VKDYWLAKLISSVEVVDSRKRLQKSIYLLQLAGCPLQCDYLLHYYGPYSFELAALIDQLDGSTIIQETLEQLALGVVRYRSAITNRGKKILSSFEKTDKGNQLAKSVAPFVRGFQELNREDLWVLELAATAAYYHQGDWQTAQKKTAAFKKVSASDINLKRAIKLARSYKKSG
jgi:uncharacterized protein YwgA